MLHHRGDVVKSQLGVCQGHSILACYADEGERRPGLGGATATGSGAIGCARAAHAAAGALAQGRQRLRDAATTHLGPIRGVGHIAHPVGLVFDGPVLPHQAE